MNRHERRCKMDRFRKNPKEENKTDELPYWKVDVRTLWAHRIPWLLFTMLCGTFTQTIISGFESRLQSVVVLTAFIPMLMGTGGNSGSQASVSVIRSLSRNEVCSKDLWKILQKEFWVALLCGASLGIAGFCKIFFLDKWLLQGEIDFFIALTVSLTLALTVVIAKCVGCLLPLFAKKMGWDPAVMATPFITTIVDVVALVAYFCTASLFLAERF